MLVGFSPAQPQQGASEDLRGLAQALLGGHQIGR
jgi:hypothetical protein